MTTLTQVGDALRADPCAWRDIPPTYQAIAQAALLPTGAFTAEQRHWFARWWLACTQDDVDAVNALLPAGTQVAGLELQGAMYLGSDLLTDAINPASVYHAALPVLEALICTYIPLEGDAP